MQGILMTAENHKATRELRKSQTRRVIVPQPSAEQTIVPTLNPNTWAILELADIPVNRVCTIKSHYKVGEVVYIKEAWYAEKQYDHLKPREIPICSLIGYLARDKKTKWAGKLRSPLFMPALLARDFIRIKNVSAERLQEISEEDAISEGINKQIKEHDASIDLRLKFAFLWDSINGKKYPWSGNWWVFVYEYEYLPDYKLGG